MTYCEQPYCRLLNGAIFFFWGDPGNSREALGSSVGALIDLLEEPFLDGSSAHEYRAPFRGDPRARFARFLKEESFSSRAKFELTSSSSEEIREGRILFMGDAPLDGGVAIPNFLYCEIPAEVAEDRLISTFCKVFSTGLYSVAFSDPILACNPKIYPKSGARAACALRGEKLLAKCADDTWLNADYRRELARFSLKLFDGPNRFTAIATSVVEERRSQLDWESILPLWDRDISDFFLIRAATSEGRRSLAAAIAPFVAELPKPRMFWKSPEWTEWRTKVLAGE